MTAYEQYKALFDQTGVTYKEEADGLTLTLEAKVGPNMKGYSGFACVFFFSADGALSEVHIVE